MKQVQLSQKTVTIGLAALFAVAGAILIIRTFAVTTPAVSLEGESYSSTSVGVTTETDNTASNGSYAILQKVTPTTPPNTSRCGEVGGSCTVAEIAKHNSLNDCWVMYNGSYYNVTSYANNHPGGPEVFDSRSCGKDITSYLNGTASNNGQHKHSSGAYRDLESPTYKIGPVAP